MTAGLMGERSKMLIFAGGGAAAIAMLLAITDLAAGFPYGKFNPTMDIMFLIAGAIVLYLCYDAFQDLR